MCKQKVCEEQCEYEKREKSGLRMVPPPPPCGETKCMSVATNATSSVGVLETELRMSARVVDTNNNSCVWHCNTCNTRFVGCQLCVCGSQNFSVNTHISLLLLLVVVVRCCCCCCAHVIISLLATNHVVFNCLRPHA